MGKYMQQTGECNIKTLSHFILLFVLSLGLSLLPNPGWAAPTSYSEYYQSVYDKVIQTAEEQGMGDCSEIIALTLESAFNCAKEKSGCQVKIDAGNQVMECNPTGPSPFDCLFDTTSLMMDLHSQGFCDKIYTPGALAMTQPGCGNRVTELGETCDDGNTLSDDDCPSTCKEPEKLCGNGVLDPNEACDAGKENGKVESGCDIQCKSFTQEEVVTEPTKVQQTTADTAPAAANCNLNQVGSSTSTSLFLYGGLILLALGMTRFRRSC